MVKKLKSILASIWADTKDTWNRSKMYLLGLAVILATIEWRKIKEALLVASGAREIKADQKQDQKLAAQENTASQQGDALVTKAVNEPNSEKPVTDDWNKS
jgi:hypothetical protein